MTRHPIAKALALGGACLALGLGPVQAQQFQSREEVNNHYAEKFNELEKQHIADLGKVAEGEKGEAAEATYRLLFNLAIARNLYSAAEPAAERVMELDEVSPDLDALAHFINAVAEADQGKYDESLDHLKEFLQHRREAGDAAERRLPAETILAVGEAYFQRLVEARQYDVAKRFVDFAVQEAQIPAVKQHFVERQQRLGLLDQPAPAVAGQDIDGNPVSLADLKGKVVLIEFWATWCPPCGPQMLRVNSVREKFKDQGFEVIGVNLDALREGAGALDTIVPAVRRYLIDLGVSWPNLLNGEGEANFAEAFGVTQIPANFLIDREGKIAGFEIGEASLEEAVEAAVVGKQAEAR